MIGFFANLRRFSAVDRLPEHVVLWESLGIEGVVSGDHVFRPNALRKPIPESHQGMDQLTILTVVATLAERLRVGTMVSNVGFQHPVLLVRKFAQLAVLYGGDRVLAGFGAGWARREFDALGLEMPKHAERMTRLEEALRVARELFDDGFSDFEGSQVSTRALPLAPRPAVPPKVLVAGGSPRLIALAARYADHWDMNVPPHRITKIEPQGRLQTTIGDLEESIRLLQAEERLAGRTSLVERSIVVDHVVICDDDEVDGESARICESSGLDAASLGDCPYALVGSKERIGAKVDELKERLGLSWIAIPFAAADVFCSDVAPLVAR